MISYIILQFQLTLGIIKGKARHSGKEQSSLILFKLQFVGLFEKKCMRSDSNSKFISGEKMKHPKGFRGKYFSLSAILALSTTVTLASSTTSIENSALHVQKQDEYAQSEEETPIQDLAPVVVISKAIKTKAVDAPFASEIYTSRDIKNSHSKNLYDFLNTYTSVNTLPSYGNPFIQKIDLRGYGLANGYQNIVISLNGRRLNNIDMTPQLLSSIPIEKIERIEIIKGSGSGR